MNKEYGLTGYLTPWGKFLKCDYGQHYKFAEVVYPIAIKKMPKLRTQIVFGQYDCILSANGFIAFGSKGEGFKDMNHVRFPQKWRDKEADKVNEIQIKWMREHFVDFDPEQQEFIRKYTCCYTDDDDLKHFPKSWEM